MVVAPVAAFRRDGLTWLMYVMLGWYALLQATPGLVIPHLRDELHLDHAVGGLHVAAFAAGSIVAGVLAARLERMLGRRQLLWTAAVLMGCGAVGLVAGRVATLTVGSVLVMGVGGGLLLVTVQAVLADHHSEHRTVALTEANVAAGVAYLVLIGALSLAAALHLGWRAAVLSCLVVPAAAWLTSRQRPIPAPSGASVATGRLPGVFWAAAGVLFCTTAAEWCMTSWGASFVEDATGVTASAAVAAMAGYFVGVLVGRTFGSRLARRYTPAPLLAAALVMTATGFATLWPAASSAQAVVGLAVLGIGLGNLFPFGMSLAIELTPDSTAQASGRVVAVTSLAVLLAPLTIGTLADARSLTFALGVVPVLLVVAGAGLVVVQRIRPRVATPS